ncbi:fungal class II heme-containing peroxidase [Teratosphaeriaceae sp. CCFEE 6253]|nr:fungal class II heme-containing peroxidase [Teratosphaeriaceae sp. CCFEE 6253]
MHALVHHLALLLLLFPVGIYSFSFADTIFGQLRRCKDQDCRNPWAAGSAGSFARPSTYSGERPSMPPAIPWGFPPFWNSRSTARMATGTSGGSQVALPITTTIPISGFTTVTTIVPVSQTSASSPLTSSPGLSTTLSTSALRLSSASISRSATVSPTSSSTASSANPPPAASAPSCPTAWSAVAADLQNLFSGCNPNARFAIRFAFHDAAGYSSKTAFYGPAAGGADGSLLLNDAESARGGNDPMQGFRTLLLQKLSQYNQTGLVGAADLVQFAGSVAILSCGSGPVVKTLVGRGDDGTACPENLLPAAFGKGADYDTLTDLFLDKGIGPAELAALMGAHTVSQAFAQRANGIPIGAPQDTTPTQWDNKYYQQFGGSTPRGVRHFESDINLAQANTTVGEEFARFAGDPDAWTTAFTGAMARLGVLGIPADVSAKFVDCASLISKL